MLPFKIHCDACSDCLEVVLLQDGHPVSYETQRLNYPNRVLGISKKRVISHHTCFRILEALFANQPSKSLLLHGKEKFSEK